MRLIDEAYILHPFYGAPRITRWLKERGPVVNHKRVARMMGVKGLQATVPGPHTSNPHPEHTIYPSLLRDLVVSVPDAVWRADITYIPMPRGLMYLVAVMDWFSRYVLAWELTLEAGFCTSALDRALEGACPAIFNADQGSQFTSGEFTGALLARDVRISMDGRGRAMDNIFIERLCRTSQASVRGWYTREPASAEAISARTVTGVSARPSTWSSRPPCAATISSPTFIGRSYKKERDQ